MNVTLPREPARRIARLDRAAAGAHRVRHIAEQPKLRRALPWAGRRAWPLAGHLRPGSVGTPGAGTLQVLSPDAPPAGADGYPRG